MNKLYLLPLSLFLINPGFATEKKLQLHVAYHDESQEAIAIHIDPELMEEIQDEISSALAEKQNAQEDAIADASEERNSKSSSRSRQQLPKFSSEMAEEEFQEEMKPAPRAKAPKARSEQSAAADQNANKSQKSEAHVRRHATPSAKAPRINNSQQNRRSRMQPMEENRTEAKASEQDARKEPNRSKPQAQKKSAQRRGVSQATSQDANDAYSPQAALQKRRISEL